MAAEKGGIKVELFIQIIGFIAVVMFIMSYQLKSNRLLYFFQLIGSGLFCVQFLMLGALSGCFSLGINIMKNALLMKCNDWKWVKSRCTMGVLCLLFTVVLILTWQGPVSLLAYIASIVSTVCYWSNNARTIRMSNLVCASPCWLIYDVIIHSWGGVVNEAITLASIVVSIIRFGWRELGEMQQ